MHLLSIIIPVYNEEKTVYALLEEMLGFEFGVPAEIIIIDDGSTDSTVGKIEQFLTDHNHNSKIKFIPCTPNRGKGYAVRQGLKNSQGTLCLIQDADFEYEHDKVPELLLPIINGTEEIVYGSRYLPDSISQNQTTLALLANKFLTATLNILYKSRLTDLHTCYKVFSSKVKDSLLLTLDDFGIDVEITTKALRKGFHIKELPIVYHARSKKGGKKITWRDGMLAFYYLIKFHRQSLD